MSACIAAGLYPIYITGGHSSSHRYSVLDFIDILGQFQIPATAAGIYFGGLSLLLAGLLVYQHRPQLFPSLPLSRKARRSEKTDPILKYSRFFLARPRRWVHQKVSGN